MTDQYQDPAEPQEQKQASEQPFVPSSRHHNFNTGAVPDELEPVTFSLNGEGFTCHAWVPGALIAEYGSYITSDRVSLNAMALLSLYNHVMTPAEAARFHQFIYNRENRVDVQVLGEIFHTLIEEYAARPLSKPGPSGNGRVGTGVTSTAGPSSQGRT